MAGAEAGAVQTRDPTVEGETLAGKWDDEKGTFGDIRTSPSPHCIRAIGSASILPTCPFQRSAVNSCTVIADRTRRTRAAAQLQGCEPCSSSSRTTSGDPRWRRRNWGGICSEPTCWEWYPSLGPAVQVFLQSASGCMQVAHATAHIGIFILGPAASTPIGPPASTLCNGCYRGVTTLGLARSRIHA